MVRTPSRDAQAGYTLAELVVVVALLLVVLVPILMTLQSSSASSNDLRKNVEARAQARSALDVFGRELRQAQTDVIGMSPVAAISPTLIRFYSPDKRTPYALREITYELSGSTLYRSVRSSTNTAPPWVFPAATPPRIPVVTSILPGARWTAYDTNWTVTSNPVNVRHLEIAFQVNGLKRASAAQSFAQTIDLRTLSTS